jgi:hypothetical protein
MRVGLLDENISLVRYGLEGPGNEFLWEKTFPRPSRLALMSTQPPGQWVTGLALKLTEGYRYRPISNPFQTFMEFSRENFTFKSPKE